MRHMYIEIENGVTKNHPAFEDTLIQAFGVIPARWEPFTRVERPVLGVYEVMEPDEPVYTKVDGVKDWMGMVYNDNAVEIRLK